ncbi:hypothetical protein OH76DRAFT_1406025 [Lentinus brumalis]|uniref:Uncharacterized protein n=1 Tax=Lentinus brumalis TaxID=2498619 RepID=A0A371D4L4_9APHY|nr:hypothetical protein OH76DRAFT_1406025 [Polyporus brumalis]
MHPRSICQSRPSTRPSILVNRPAEVDCYRLLHRPSGTARALPCNDAPTGVPLPSLCSPTTIPLTGFTCAPNARCIVPPAPPALSHAPTGVPLPSLCSPTTIPLTGFTCAPHARSLLASSLTQRAHRRNVPEGPHLASSAS